MADHIFGIDPGVIDHLLPLGDSLIGAVVTIFTAGVTYLVGRSKTKAELDKLASEKKAIEAATGVSTAEAAQVISEAAASTVQPLLERIREQREDIRFLTDRNVTLRDEVDTLRITAARLRAQNEILRTQLQIQEHPEIPPEVN